MRTAARVATASAILLVLALARAASAGVLDAPPQPPDPAQRYLFYLHGKIVEDAGRNARHPRFGAYEYDAITQQLASHGATVIAELRPPGADVEIHARKLGAQVKALLDAGVPAAHVAVVGFSKGGEIAQRVARRLDADVRYVILAGCFGAAQDAQPRMHGRVLSLRERSDRLARSCTPGFDAARAAAQEQTEIVLELGGEHGAFYRPDPRWVQPLLAWVDR